MVIYTGTLHMFLLFLIFYTYTVSLLDLAILVLAYSKEIDGIWPPGSRIMSAVGWTLYISPYITLFSGYLRSPALTVY